MLVVIEHNEKAENSGTLLTMLKNSKHQGNERTRGEGASPSTKTADKNNGGQALDLVTIAPKTDSNKPMHRESCKSKKYWTTEKVLCIVIVDSLDYCERSKYDIWLYRNTNSRQRW